MKIRNVCPIGDLDVPLLNRIVAAGEVVDVTPAQAAMLLQQASNYEPADDEARAVLGESPAIAQPEIVQDPTDPGAGTSQNEGTDQL